MTETYFLIARAVVNELSKSKHPEIFFLIGACQTEFVIASIQSGTA